MPVITFVIICLPAVVNAVAMAQRRPPRRPLRHLLGQLRVLVLLVFIAAQAPELVSRDLRSHVLPLYFARPIRRMDYPLAKLAAFFAGLPDHDRGPAAAALHGTVTQVHGGSAIWAQTRALIPGLLVGLMWAVLPARSGSLLASFSGRRAFATGASRSSCSSPGRWPGC